MIYRMEALSKNIQTILKKNCLPNKVNILDVNQIDVVAATETTFKEVLVDANMKEKSLIAQVSSMTKLSAKVGNVVNLTYQI